MKQANHFWAWNSLDEGERELILDGSIASESWYDDEISPKMFRDELFSGTGPVTIRINSPGGDCFAASQIYTMLMDYPGKVTTKIDGIAASAASVVAMAGETVIMAPTALMMIHDPWTIALGNEAELQKTIDMLSEVKESIINAYELKTGQDRKTIGKMMSNETWMNAKKAKELGFCNVILGEDEDDKDPDEDDEPPTPPDPNKEPEPEPNPDEPDDPDEDDEKKQNMLRGYTFSSKLQVAAMLTKMKGKNPSNKVTGTPVADLRKRLALLER